MHKIAISLDNFLYYLELCLLNLRFYTGNKKTPQWKKGGKPLRGEQKEVNF